MDYPITLKPSDGELLRVLGSGGNTIEVRELNGLRWMRFGGNAIQAMLELDSPSVPIIPYQRAMLLALLYFESPAKVLNLGTGGASFERFFAKLFTSTEVTSIESNPSVIQLLSDYFHVPETVHLVNADAASFLAAQEEEYDLIMCDLFSQDQQPSCITQKQFYRDAFNILSGNGVMAINTLPQSEVAIVNILLAMRMSFKQVMLLELQDFKNILLFGLKGEVPGSTKLRQRCQDLKDLCGLDLSFALGGVRELPAKGNQIQNNIPNR